MRLPVAPVPGLPVVAGFSVLAWLALTAPSLLAQERARTPGGGEADSAVAADTLDPPPPAVAASLLTGDSVRATPGETYEAGWLHRFLFGDLNRELWEIPIRVPVLDLDAVAGGLELEKPSGGKQTFGAHLESADGRTFQFRSMVKTTARALPPLLRSTPVEEVTQDQMAALFPLGAMVVAELLKVADVLVATPRPVVMPDDPRLGELREALAGRMGWLEERPNEREGDRPGFAGSAKITASDALFERLEEDPRSYVNARTFLRARLIDMLVGDWDRHADQWRWASFEEEDRTRWEPIPRDRDWAFARIDGLLPGLSRIYSIRYVGFSDAPPDVFALAWQSQKLDRRLLAGVERETFVAVADSLQERLTDEAIRRAVGVLPPPYLEAAGDRLVRSLILRRDALPEVAAEFYDLLADRVDVFGTELGDSLFVERRSDGATTVRLLAGPDRLPTLERTFRPEETSEVRVYLGDGDDRVAIASQDASAGGDVRYGTKGIRLRLALGAGKDRVDDATSGKRVHVYDPGDGADAVLGADARLSTSPGSGQEEPPEPEMAWDTRDWGSSWVPLPEVHYSPDVGLYLGAGLTRYGFGYGYRPFRSRYSVALLNGFDGGQWLGEATAERPFGQAGWRGRFSAGWATERPFRVFGLGNETEEAADEEVRSRRNQLDLDLMAIFRPDSTWRLHAGPTGSIAGAIRPVGTPADTFSVYGTDAFTAFGLRAGGSWDVRDARLLPSRGGAVSLDARIFPPVADVEETYVTVAADARWIATAPLPGRPALRLSARGETSSGLVPYGDLPFLGGSDRLPGYAERRFVGESALAGAALIRFELLDLPPFDGTRLGVHGLAAAGRTWLDGESSDTWHSSFGAGVWIAPGALRRVIAATYVAAPDGRGAFYLGTDFPM